MPERRPRTTARTRGARSKAPAGKAAGRAQGAARKRPTAPAARRRVPPGSDRSFLWRWRRGLFMGGLVLVAASSGAGALVFNLALPPEESLLQTSFVCAADVAEACGPENAIASFSAEEDRTNVHLDEVPEVLQRAVLATEDQDYYEHGGVDPVGISRALYNDIRGTGSTQGGSTITQQYVKNVYLTSERSIVRKLKEAVLAVKLERELSKDEILERYLNTIYFGRGAYGVDAASRAYYGKDVEDIGLLEASYLAGLIRSPGGADALQHPEEATRRRGTVLNAMERQGFIDGDERDLVAHTPIDTGVVAARDRQGLGRVEGNTADDNIGTKYFVEAVRRQIAEQYGEDVLYGGGLRIYTTLDFDMQRAAWDAVTATLDQPADPDAALVAVDQYGYVKAMVGGRSFEDDEVNLALGAAAGGSGRGAGSSFKPFVLAEAIRQGISLNSKFNAPASITFEDVQGAKPGEPWKVSNYGGTEQGVLDIVDATRVSSNTAYAQLMLEVGAGNVASLANKLGVSAKLPVVDSLVLGSGDVSPLDMAVGYSTFANRGVHNDPVLVAKVEQVDEDGRVRVLQQAVPTGKRVLSEEQADLVTYCLQEVVKGGTGSSASFGKPAAGKTGTTQDNKDAWFVGYTPKLTAAVWVGYAHPRPDGTVPTMDEDSPVSRSRGLHGVTGGSLPAAIWKRFMVAATEGKDMGTFVRPTSFPGRILHEDLEQTTTTDATPSTSSSSTSSTTSTTVEETTTSTSSTTTTTSSTTTTSGQGPPVN
ncbi:MAG: transglycosylase domain-containing protein [Acidimicrobiales bacterium]